MESLHRSILGNQLSAPEQVLTWKAGAFHVEILGWRSQNFGKWIVENFLSNNYDLCLYAITQSPSILCCSVT